MFNHSGDERILEGRDIARASCLLCIYLIIPCHLVNAICPTSFFPESSAGENHLIGSFVCVKDYRIHFRLT